MTINAIFKQREFVIRKVGFDIERSCLCSKLFSCRNDSNKRVRKPWSFEEISPVHLFNVSRRILYWKIHISSIDQLLLARYQADESYFPLASASVERRNRASHFNGRKNPKNRQRRRKFGQDKRYHLSALANRWPTDGKFINRNYPSAGAPMKKMVDLANDCEMKRRSSQALVLATGHLSRILRLNPTLSWKLVELPCTHGHSVERQSNQRCNFTRKWQSCAAPLSEFLSLAVQSVQRLTARLRRPDEPP